MSESAVSAILPHHLSDPILQEIPWVRHGFSTRKSPWYEDPAWAGLPSLSLQQVHGSRTVIVEKQHIGHTIEADAMVTDQPGLLLTIVTADCVPVILADRSQAIVGIAHAGWRGSCHGILESVCEGMLCLGADPSHLVAALGPCIHQAQYEVDHEVYTLFVKQNAAYRMHFKPSERLGHYFFDLMHHVKYRLLMLNLSLVSTEVALDTYTGADDFFSHRRFSQKKETSEKPGRQSSCVCLL